MGWVWLDGVEHFEKSRVVKAWKKWENPFPAAYLVEMMAQGGAILLGAENGFSEDLVFIKMQDIQFLGRPEGGQRLEVQVEPEGLRPEGGWFRGVIRHEGNKLVEGKVLLMNVGRLRPDGQGPITFPRHLIEGLEKRCGKDALSSQASGH